ncbi:MAG: GldG family protein, partial [Conexibacteraceae bacterium]|nr:GldG family protein [Conexibacteraceae bacterium]
MSRGVSVIFDEAHSEAWTISPQRAAEMQPVHPGDASYARAAELLRTHGFGVASNSSPLEADVLSDCDLLVIAHPSDPQWESTTGGGSPRLAPAELDAIEAYVRGGGGLLVLGETENDKYGNNLNELLARFGLRLRNDTVQDYEHSDGAPTWIRGELGEGGRGSDGDLLAGVSGVCLYRATTIEARNGSRVLASTYPTASVPGAPLIVASEHGDGRVVVLADSDLFGDDCIGAFDHSALWLNVVYWASRSAPARAARPLAEQPGVEALIEATNALAELQAADGSLAADADRAEASARVGVVERALRALEGDFPNLTAAAEDLRAWADGGYGKPDFARALAAFRPEQGREDGRL